MHSLTHELFFNAQAGSTTWTSIDRQQQQQHWWGMQDSNECGTKQRLCFCFPQQQTTIDSFETFFSPVFRWGRKWTAGGAITVGSYLSSRCKSEVWRWFRRHKLSKHGNVIYLSLNHKFFLLLLFFCRQRIESKAASFSFFLSFFLMSLSSAALLIAFSAASFCLLCVHQVDRPTGWCWCCRSMLDGLLLWCGVVWAAHADWWTLHSSALNTLASMTAACEGMAYLLNPKPGSGN